MTDRLIQTAKVVTLIAPKADVFADSARSGAINMRDYNVCTALICKGAMSATGAAVVTVNSTATSAGTGLTAVPFRLKRATDGTLDAYDAEVNVTASGYTIEANTDNLVDIIEFDDSDLDGTDKYATILVTESTDDTITAGIVGILTGGRQQGDGKRSVRV